MNVDEAAPTVGANESDEVDGGTSTSPAKSQGKRTRKPRPYPNASFEEALELGTAIQVHASGGPVRRLTLLEKMGKSPTSGTTRDLITNSSKYGVTSGSFNAETLGLTELGAIASDPTAQPGQKLAARYELAIRTVVPFRVLYDEYVGKRLPSHEVMQDVLKDQAPTVDETRECVDLFVVNAQFLGLLRPIGGVETLVTPDDVGASSPETTSHEETTTTDGPAPGTTDHGHVVVVSDTSGVDWQRMCFFIAPIGEDGSEARKHSDLVLRQLVEPALNGDLDIVRADAIDESGMITSQVIEYISRARLVIADLSFHNPNVFYELALRHACRKPVIHLIRKADKIPFDLTQSRVIQIDTTDIYTLVPQMETYKTQIGTFARSALGKDDATGPLEVYFPGFWNEIAQRKKP